MYKLYRFFPLLASFFIITGCLSGPGAGKSSVPEPPQIGAVNRLVRNGLSITIPEGWLFSYQEKPGTWAGIYTPDNINTGIIEICSSKISPEKPGIPELFNNNPVKNKVLLRELKWVLVKDENQSESHVYITQPPDGIKSEVYCMQLTGSAVTGLWLSSKNLPVEDLLPIAYAVSVKIEDTPMITQQRIIDRHFSIFSQDGKWIWHNDIKGGCIFTITAGEFPLSISIQDDDTGDLFKSFSKDAAKVSGKQVFIGNRLLEAEAMELSLDTSASVYLRVKPGESYFLITVTSAPGSVDNPSELLELKAVKDFFAYNAVF